MRSELTKDLIFQSSRKEHPGGFIEFREELLTGIRTRICPERLKRGLSTPDIPDYSSSDCPFCPEMVEQVTPVFQGGLRIKSGESITFPNLFPFASYHVVTVITNAHTVSRFTSHQISDALVGQFEALRDSEDYVSINWNYLPSAGASLPHPHLQGLADPVPDTLLRKYLDGSESFYQKQKGSWWDLLKEHETKGERHLSGTRLFWYAHPVPIGERDIRCILPVTTIQEFRDYIPTFSEDLVNILDFYRDIGNVAWNMSIFFGKETERGYFSAFCILIARINPNPLSTSDTAFMEKLHLEPVIMTLPEELALLWRDGRG